AAVLPAADSPLVRSDATYLITGGVGGLGLEVAHWLVESGATHVLLLSRRSASAVARQRIADLEQRGARVLVANADVSRADELAGAVRQTDATWPPVRGVIHAAGVVDDGVLAQQSWERFEGVMAAKV